MKIAYLVFILLNLGRQLPTPNETRWNAHYNCLSVLLEQDEKKLKSLMNNLNIAALSSQEIAFIKEYLTMLKPIAISLDILLEKNNAFLDASCPF